MTECIFIFAHPADTTGMKHLQIYLNFIFITFRALALSFGAVACSRKQPITLVTSVPPARLSACISAAPADRFPWNLILDDFYGNLSRNSNFFFFFSNSDRNIGHFTDEDLMIFLCCWRHKLTLKHSHAIPCVFISLTTTGNPTTHTERIFRSSITKIDTQKRHGASLSAHCQSCLYSGHRHML